MRPAGPAILLLLSVCAFYFWNRLAIPRIERLDPAVAQAGTVVRILGKNFGAARGGSCVVVDGEEPTRSSYRSWTPSVIELVVPPTVDSGLVRVRTRFGLSNPVIYLDSDLLPVIPAKR